MVLETEGDLKCRQSKEKKDLIALVTSLKRAVNKTDSKHKKEVQVQVQQLEKEMKDRHQKELNDLILETSAVNITNDEPVNCFPQESKSPQKKTKAQKNREKKDEKDQRMREAMKQDALNAATSKGTLEMEKIKGILAERGLTLVDILPDGDCMYNALAYQLSAQDLTSKITGEQIRELTANYLIANKDSFLPFLGNGDLDNNGFQVYCDKVRSPCRHGGEWGGEPELQALSSAIEKPVEVLHADGEPHRFGQDFTAKPLILTYHRHAYSLGEHYNSTAPL